MFQSITPVCPVTDMERTVKFWARLGFEVYFTDETAPEAAAYCGVRRGNLALHLQAFTPEQLKTTQTMALRVWMRSREDLDALAEEWSDHGVISAPLEDKPWATGSSGYMTRTRLHSFSVYPKRSTRPTCSKPYLGHRLWPYYDVYCSEYNVRKVT